MTRCKIYKTSYDKTFIKATRTLSDAVLYALDEDYMIVVTNGAIEVKCNCYGQPHDNPLTDAQQLLMSDVGHA